MTQRIDLPGQEESFDSVCAMMVNPILNEFVTTFNVTPDEMDELGVSSPISILGTTIIRRYKLGDFVILTVKMKAGKVNDLDAWECLVDVSSWETFDKAKRILEIQKEMAH